MRRLCLTVSFLFIAFSCFAQQNRPCTVYGTFEANSTKIYKIQVGAYSNQGNARNAITRLQRQNLNPVIETYLQYSRVRLRGIPANQVNNTLAVIKKAGFNEVWIQQDTQAAPPQTTQRPVPSPAPTPTPTPTQGNIYYYEPTVSVITGLLKTESVDMSEITGERSVNYFFIFLDNPITVMDTKKENETVYNISKIQLTGRDDFSTYKGKRVQLTGTFYFWHTAYHHTKVLMFVDKVTEAPADRTPPPERASYNIGDRGPAGGIVFYDKGSFSDGWRYMEAAPADSRRIERILGGNIVTETGTRIGDGKRNTSLIITAYTRYGEFDTAAQLCKEYALNGYRDWFLPSKVELDLLYRNLKLRGVGNLNNGWYWSSSHEQHGTIWVQSFGNGTQKEHWSGGYNSVRPVRAF